MPIENGHLCRNEPIPLHQILGMKGFNAFGSSFQFGQADGIEGPWVAPIFTAGILFIIAYLTYSAKLGSQQRGPTLLRKIIALYAFNTAVVEVCRVLFDVNRFALVWAALHNLPEWGIIAHLVTPEAGIPKFWERALLWIWLVSQVVLFAPNFKVGAMAEQVTGIWCDWLLVSLFLYNNLRRDRRTTDKVKKVYRMGLLGAALHMAEILPLVSLLVGLITLPSIPGSILIAVSEPVTFYLYYQFALEWDRSLLQPGELPPQPTGDADAPNGTALPNQHEQPTVYIAGKKDDEHPGTEPALRIKAAFAAGTFVLGLLTVAAPVAIIPTCQHQTTPDFALFRPMLGRGGAQHVTSADDLPTLLAPGPGGGPAVGPAGGLAFGSAGGPLCRAPQTVEGTTFIYARPGRSNELATLLESHPMSAHKDEGNLKFEVSESDDHTFRIDERWTSKRTMFNRFTKPDSRTYLTPAFHDLVANVSVAGPFHPFIPCAAAAMQPREYFLREPVVVDAPLGCVWEQLDNFADGSTSVGCLASTGALDGNPDLRAVVEPFPAPPANCTMRQMRQRVPRVPQPDGGHTLIYHTLSGCWVDPTRADALVETQITEIMVTPHEGSSATTGKTDLVYTLRLSPKTVDGTEAMLTAFRAGNAVHVPGLKKLLEQRCAGARISALSRELAAASGVAFPL